jgi:tRNA-dependent cyclodipeptide synthase
MPFEQKLTTAGNSTALAGVLSFLNHNNVRFRLCHFSPSSTEDEIDQEAVRLGLGLVWGIRLDRQGEEPILAIIPSSMELSLGEFSKLLGSRVVRGLSISETQECALLTCSIGFIPPLGGLLRMPTFSSPLIEHQDTIGFFVESRNTLVTLPLSEFRRTIFSPSAIPVPTSAKYRAYASPGRKTNARCILGVSLENRDFHTSKFVTIIDWISKHYSECIVMLGDGLHRITLQLGSNVSEREALEHAKWLARDFVHSHWPVIAFNESSCQFSFVFCSDIQTTDCYFAHYGRLFKLFTDNAMFRDSVRTFSLEFLRRKPQREGGEEHLEMSSRYLLEELAVISCLTQDLACTFVYPGSLTILREIADGKHPSLPECLLQIEYVELKLKHRDK